MNGIERIWLARCEQSHYFSLISFLISARTTKNGVSIMILAFWRGLSEIPWEKKNRKRGTDPFDGEYNRAMIIDCDE